MGSVKAGDTIGMGAIGVGSVDMADVDILMSESGGDGIPWSARDVGRLSIVSAVDNTACVGAC